MNFNRSVPKLSYRSVL